MATDVEQLHKFWNSSLVCDKHLHARRANIQSLCNETR